MVVNIKDIEDNIVLALRTNISDPLNRSGSRNIGKFIDHGRGHYKGKTPRILIQRGGEIISPYTGTGEIKQDYNIRFMIRIEVQASVSGMVTVDSADTQYSGSALASVLSDQVAEVMEDNALSITGIKQIQRESMGEYMYNEMHYYIHIYQIYVVNS